MEEVVFVLQSTGVGVKLIFEDEANRQTVAEVFRAPEAETGTGLHAGLHFELGWGAKFGPEGSSIIGSPSGNPVDRRQHTDGRMRTNRIVGFYPTSNRNNSLLIAVEAFATDECFTLEGAPD